MSEEVTVEDLLRGSAELDRMRREIETVTGMLLGLVRPENCDAMLLREVLLDGGLIRFGHLQEDGSCAWDIRWINQTLQARCVVLLYNGQATAYLSKDAPPEWRGGEQLRCRGIKIAHEALPIFLKGMLADFRSLRGSLQPFLEAAGK